MKIMMIHAGWMSAAKAGARFAWRISSLGRLWHFEIC